MGSCCGCGKNNEENDKNKEKTGKNPTTPSGTQKPPKSPTSPGFTDNKEKSNSSKSAKEMSKKGPLYKSDIDETETDEKKLVEDEKFDKEVNRGIKGGESAYGKVMPPKSKKDSKDYAIVKEYLANQSYQLIEQIGSGNYAEVYKAFYPQKQRYVAVKVIDLQKANLNYRKNFLPREISILRQLKHPSIIKIYEISQTTNKIFMIMEFAMKGTLADWLRDNGSFSEVMAWDMFKKILESLHYMHSFNIAHRDLKLENILITDKLNPKLSDFSYAINVDEKTPLSQTFCGSLPYFAPEVMQRKPYNPFLSDIWSLGVCLYVMINDGLPFKINDEKAMLNSQLNREWDFKKRVEAKLSPELKAMVRKMLEPDVTKRATTHTLIKDQWITTTPKSSE